MGNLNAMKPPLGIIPKGIWQEMRLTELKGAIERYLLAGLEVDLAWVKELNELCEELGHTWSIEIKPKSNRRQ